MRAVRTLEMRVKESVEFHGPAENLREPCKVDREVRACTDFIREQFFCHCEEGGDGWRIVVAAELSAVVHVTSPRYLTHERLHMQDVEAELPIVLARFLEMRFTSEKPCSTLAHVMSLPSFAVQIMNGIRAGSNERLGCVKAGSSKAASRKR